MDRVYDCVDDQADSQGGRDWTVDEVAKYAQVGDGNSWQHLQKNAMSLYSLLLFYCRCVDSTQMGPINSAMNNHFVAACLHYWGTGGAS